MSLFPRIMALEKPLESFAKFFISNDNQQEPTTTFTHQFGLPPWAYQTIPKNGNFQQRILPLSNSLF